MTDLVTPLMNNEEWAYRQFVKEYGKRIYNICFYILHDRSEAEDTTQEVFISVFQSIHSFRGDAHFSTWVHRLTLNKCNEKLRFKNRKKRKGAMVLIENQVDLASQDISPEGLLIKNEEIAILFDAISGLSENQHIAYTLHNMQEMSYVEIAENMNLSVSAVESLIFRAKQNLRKILQEKLHADDGNLKENTRKI
jgi:RNA polymerase sigma factor (sigma-70 family)